MLDKKATVIVFLNAGWKFETALKKIAPASTTTLASGGMVFAAKIIDASNPLGLQVGSIEASGDAAVSIFIPWRYVDTIVHSAEFNKDTTVVGFV